VKPALAFVTAASALHGQTWREDMWQPINGVWKIEHGEYVQTDHRARGAWSLWKAGEFVDVDVQVRFKIDPAGRGVRAAGIVFKAVDDQHLFFAHFDSRNNQVLVSRWSGRTGWRHLARLSKVGLKQSVWHMGRVRCAGRKAAVYLDGRRLGIADGVSQLPGRVGLRTGQGRVRFRDWSVKSTPAPHAQARATAVWWDAAWRRRIPITITEKGHGDRWAALLTVRLSPGTGTRGGTDIALTDAAGRRVPCRVRWLPAAGRQGPLAEVTFPARVAWMDHARYYAYFDNPRARRDTSKELAIDTIDLSALTPDSLAANWSGHAGSWQIKPMSRPERNDSARPAVESDRHVAFPGICRTQTGALVVVYREGYSHASGQPDDGRVMLVRSPDKGKTWSQPVVVQDDPGADDRNAAIECMADGTLCLIWDKYGTGRYPKPGHHWAWMRTSTDEGRTWSEPAKVSKDENVHTRSRPLDLGNGKWLIPYSESTSRPTASSYFCIYDPGSGSFEEIAATPLCQRNVADETAVVRAANRDLVALIRSNTDPALFQIVSKDDGRTWSAPRLTSIPSQFTPADLVTLHNGWLLCSFSFRERRNERLVVSRDNGATWDVENSVDLFDGTMAVGGDRSYPASVQIDPETVGTVLYETQTPPAGGRIWFVTTPMSALDPEQRPALYQGDVQADAAFIQWPPQIQGAAVEFEYRFTGLFGSPPNRVGLLLRFQDEANYAAFEFQMGAAADRRSVPTNTCCLVECTGGRVRTLSTTTAKGDWFNDGNVHRMAAYRREDEWVCTLDGVDQLSAPASLGRPCGIVTRRAAVAVYQIRTYSHPVQANCAGMQTQAGEAEQGPKD